MPLGHHYRILPQKGSATHYTLFGGEIQLATLVLHNRHGSQATIQIGTKTISIDRRAYFKKHLLVERAEGTAAFMADGLSRGTFTTSDAAYRWLPHNVRWTAWAWQSEYGHQLLSVHLHHRLGTYRGDVRAGSPVLTDLQKELVLLGWYLMLLNQQHFGMHLLTALSVRSNRGRVSVK